MPRLIAELSERDIPALSDFLARGLSSPLTNPRFAKPDVLWWKYFDPAGPWSGSRSLVVLEDGKIVAHAGICLSEFRWGPQGVGAAPTVHIVDWLTSSAGDALGAMLMLKAFGRAPVQYALGCSPAAREVLLRIGFREVIRAPLFHKVFSPFKRDVWTLLHGAGGGWRSCLLLGVDLIQSTRARIQGQRDAGMTLEQVANFDPAVTDLLRPPADNVVFSSRQSELLNHFLRFPGGGFTGWLLKSGGEPVGVALLSVTEKLQLRVGRIVDCFLSTDSVGRWRGALGLLERQLETFQCDVVSCFGTAPWLVQALREAGYFRRGGSVFYLRDAQKLLPAEPVFHLTHLEADLAYS